MPKLQANPHRLKLHIDLNRFSSNLGNMYYGALLVIEQNQNPERFVLAAHCLRELMEKIPQYINVEMKAHGETLKQQVIEVGDLWKGTVGSKCNTPGGWSGSIDKPLQKFLARFSIFNDWFEKHYPRRMAELQTLLRALQKSDKFIPKRLEDEQIEKWRTLNERFQGISHHRIRVSEEDFNLFLEELEIFLAERLAPKTFDDFVSIDEIIGKGENDD
jgi:hypothetical protein